MKSKVQTVFSFPSLLRSRYTAAVVFSLAVHLGLILGIVRWHVTVESAVGSASPVLVSLAQLADPEPLSEAAPLLEPVREIREKESTPPEPERAKEGLQGEELIPEEPPSAQAPVATQTLPSEEILLSDGGNESSPGAETRPVEPVERNDGGTPASPGPSFSSLSRGLSLSLPAYPAAARKWGYEGEVLVSISVDGEGRVSEVVLLSSSGYDILDKEVIKTIRKKWRFNPPGEAVVIEKLFEFRLD